MFWKTYHTAFTHCSQTCKARRTTEPSKARNFRRLNPKMTRNTQSCLWLSSYKTRVSHRVFSLTLRWCLSPSQATTRERASQQCLRLTQSQEVCGLSANKFLMVCFWTSLKLLHTSSCRSHCGKHVDVLCWMKWAIWRFIICDGDVISNHWDITMGWDGDDVVPLLLKEKTTVALPRLQPEMENDRRSIIENLHWLVLRRG